MVNSSKSPSVDTLALCIQAIDAELQSLRKIPEDEIHADEQILYIKYQKAAGELKKIYAFWAQEFVDLTPYSKLTPHQSHFEKIDSE